LNEVKVAPKFVLAPKSKWVSCENINEFEANITIRMAINFFIIINLVKIFS